MRRLCIALMLVAGAAWGQVIDYSPVPWTPAELDGLAVWLDGKDTNTLTFSGLNVAQWDDKSGNEYHFLGLDNLPTYEDGGVRFREVSATVGQRMINTNISLTQPGTVAVATRWDGGGTKRNYVFDGYNPSALVGAGRWIYALTESAKPKIYAGSAFIGDLANTTTNGNVSVIQFDGTNSFLSVDAIKSTGNPGANTLPLGFVLGQNYRPALSGTDDPLNGWIYEFIVFDRNLTTEEAELVEGYMAHAHGTEGNLPESHPYIETPPYIPQQTRQAFTEFRWDEAGTNYTVHLGTDATNLTQAASTTNTSAIIDLRDHLPDYSPEAFWRVDVETETNTVTGAVVQFSYVLSAIGDPDAEVDAGRADPRVTSALFQFIDPHFAVEPYGSIAAGVPVALFRPAITQNGQDESWNAFEATPSSADATITADGFSVTNNARFVVADDDRLTLSNGFTVAYWVRRDGNIAAEWTEAGKSSDKIAGEWLMGVDAGAMYFGVADNVTGGSMRSRGGGGGGVGGLTAVGVWVHRVGVWDGGTTTDSLRHYMNGSRVDASSASGGTFTAMRNTTLNLQIGASTGRAGVPVTITEFVIYDRPLSQAEITELYNRTKEIVDP